LVLQDLTENPGAIAYIQACCDVCMSKAEKTNSQSPFGTWYQMITKPLTLTGKDRMCKDRVSLMLMFHEMLETNSGDRIRVHLLEDNDLFMLDVLSTYRAWCKTVAFHLDTEADPNALKRLLIMIKDMYGEIVSDEVEKMVTSCRRHLLKASRWNCDRVWPADQPRSDALFFARARAFQDHARSKDLTFPLDLKKDPRLRFICLAVNSWTAELMGPPQVRDMRLEAILPEVTGRKLVKHRDVDDMRDRIEDVNIEAMRLKVQMYELHQATLGLEVIRNTGELNKILDIVEELKRRGRALASLQDKMRQSWDTWVTFAKQFQDRL